MSDGNEPDIPMPKRQSYIMYGLLIVILLMCFITLILQAKESSALPYSGKSRSADLISNIGSGSRT